MQCIYNCAAMCYCCGGRKRVSGIWVVAVAWQWIDLFFAEMALLSIVGYLHSVLVGSSISAPCIAIFTEAKCGVALLVNLV